MVRYSLLAMATTIAAPSRAHETTGAASAAEAWSYLPATLPSPLSDMGVSLVAFNGTDGGAGKKRVVLTGGCDAADGNVYAEDGEDEWFECRSLTNRVYAFDPIRHSQFQAWNGEFHALADMPRARARHGSVVVRGMLCVFGGRDLADVLIPEVDCYDPSTNEWSDAATMLPPERRTSDFAIFADEDDVVYLVGGYDQNYTAFDQVTAVDMSSFPSVAYSDGPRLGSARGDIDVALVNGDAYVSGGFTHEDMWSNPLNTVEKYDRESGRWTDVSSLNDERGDKQLVALDGRVYAIGGEDKIDTVGVDIDITGMGSQVLDSVEVLDVSEDVHGGLAEWRHLGGMPAQLFRFAASEWEVEDEEEGYIFVFGGQVGYNTDCKCFRTTDGVMVFDVAHAVEASPEAMGSGAGVAKAAGVSSLFVFVVSLAWLALRS